MIPKRLKYIKRLFGELIVFSIVNKKATPLLLTIVIILFTAVVVTTQAAVPFIYTLF